MLKIFGMKIRMFFFEYEGFYKVVGVSIYRKNRNLSMCFNINEIMFVQCLEYDGKNMLYVLYIIYYREL